MDHDQLIIYKLISCVDCCLKVLLQYCFILASSYIVIVRVSILAIPAYFSALVSKIFLNKVNILLIQQISLCIS